MRGIEGKINAARIARERGIPFLGICLGMQLAVVDFARHVVGMAGANSAEFDPETPYPVVDLLPEQKEVDDMGGTMRLGADPVKLHAGTRAREVYDEPVIYERHRHRYEVNNLLRRRLEDAGLVCSGTSPDDRLVEVMELPDHPFFVASQYHPEFKSRPNRPEPLFREFVGAALERARERGTAGAEDGGRRRHRGAAPDHGRASRAPTPRGPADGPGRKRSARRTLKADAAVEVATERRDSGSPTPSCGCARSRARRGARAAVARAVRAELEALGLTVEEDGSAAETGADCGNLLAASCATGTPGAR